jgi:hypothetical protein
VPSARRIVRVVSVFVAIVSSSTVILNTLESVTALLEKRGSIYSHRPTLIMLGQLMGLNRVGAHIFFHDRFNSYSFVTLELGPL